MKRYIFTLLISLMAFAGFSQETPPPVGPNFKQLSTSTFFISLPDSAIWQYKGATYGWAKIARYKDVKGVIDGLALKVDKTTTVNGHALSSNVTVTKGDVGLGDVDNTSDVNKPISTAQQTALDLKAPIAGSLNYIQAGPVTPQSAAINLLLPPAPSGTDNRGVEYLFNPNGIVRMGGSDTTPQDDERNYGALLPSPNWWGSASNLGIYSFASGRNSAAYAPYSAGFGHDNIIYGTAAMAGGAGSIAGDPGSLTGVDANQNAYSSIVWGKNLKGKGAKSASFGEEGGSGSRANFTAGYYAITNETVAGIGTSAIGYNVNAEGDGGFSYGQWANATARAQLIGSGINDGSRMTLARRALGLGVNTLYPTVILEEADGTTNGRSNVGIGLYGAAANNLLEVGGNTNITGGENIPSQGSNGLYLSYTGSTSYINSLAPNISWQNLIFGANEFRFKTSEIERLSVLGNGNIGFNQPVPLARLHFTYNEANSNAIRIEDTNGSLDVKTSGFSDPLSYALVDITNSIDRFISYSNGDFVIPNGKATVAEAPINPTDVVRKTELDLKEDLTNKSTSTSLGTSNTLYPTQNAVKTYVDGLLSSGTYTPTVTNVTNVASSSGVQPAHYIRVGNEVTVKGSFVITVTTANSGTTFEINLPIASAFSSFGELTGFGVLVDGSGTYTPPKINANFTTDKASFNYLPGSSTAGNIYYSFTYTVL